MDCCGTVNSQQKQILSTPNLIIEDFDLEIDYQIARNHFYNDLIKYKKELVITKPKVYQSDTFVVVKDIKNKEVETANQVKVDILPPPVLLPAKEVKNEETQAKIAEKAKVQEKPKPPSKEDLKRIQDKAKEMLSVIPNVKSEDTKSKEGEGRIINMLGIINTGKNSTEKQISFTKRYIIFRESKPNQQAIQKLESDHKTIYQQIKQEFKNKINPINTSKQQQQLQQQNPSPFYPYQNTWFEQIGSQNTNPYQSQKKSKIGGQRVDTQIGSFNPGIKQNQDACHFGLIILQKTLKKQNIKTFITTNTIANQIKVPWQQNQQFLLQMGNYQQHIFCTITYPPNQLDQQLVNAGNLQKFTQDFKEKICNQLNGLINKDDITILSISQLPQQNIDFKITLDVPPQIIKEKLSQFHSLGLEVSIQNLLDFAQLSIDMFDPAYNRNWNQEKYANRTTYRGVLQLQSKPFPTPQQYKFPIGYRGLALKALDIDPEDKYNEWLLLGERKNTWIVLYHGTKNESVSPILKSSFLAGERNIYGGHTCRITGNSIKKGEYAVVYMTDDVNVAEHYAPGGKIFNGKSYRIVFQCRVRPSGIMSPIDKPSYYTIENPERDIRPYRILIQECEPTDKRS